MATIPHMHPVDTAFLRRLRARDEQAWFELWEAFGPVIRGTLARWGNGRLGEETLRDLTQDTLAALSDSIERFDPQRGVRFSTWLLAIAKHVLGDEMDRRYAQKRGSG
jgi:DNA-directed RNA polymerase specialized sigma24 family protein